MLRVRSLALVVVALALGWSSWLGAATTKALPARQGDIPLDLAALAIYPQDTGADGYVLVNGRSCLTVAACADPVFFGSATEASLTEAGLTRTFALVLAQFGTDGTTGL